MKRVTSVLVLGLLMIGSVLFVVTYDSIDLDKATVPKDSFFDHLVKQNITKASIEADFSELIYNRDQKIKQAALLSIGNSPETLKEFPIKISLRGKTRRALCEFPPLKLKFSETLLKTENFTDAHDDYKLVTHCMGETETVLKEYLAYQLYNQLTNYSFRVHLLEVTYIDQSGNMEPIQQYGFLIENYGEMAHRLGAEKLSNQLLPNTKVPLADYQRLALFQYMIGNTDWNLYRQHNIKWLRVKNIAIPVPYDFDSAGLVAASYAKPHPSLPIATVQERFLQYRGGSLLDLENGRAELHQKELVFIQLLEACPSLSSNEKQAMLNYLNDFFTMEQLASSTSLQ